MSTGGHLVHISSEPRVQSDVSRDPKITLSHVWLSWKVPVSRFMVFLVGCSILVVRQHWMPARQLVDLTLSGLTLDIQFCSAELHMTAYRRI